MSTHSKERVREAGASSLDGQLALRQRKCMYQFVAAHGLRMISSWGNALRSSAKVPGIPPEKYTTGGRAYPVGLVVCSSAAH